MRIGHGYDAHRFGAAGSQAGGIVLGGVDIPYDRSLEAHSDGDVLLHALCDALLGAAGLGDIGQHFPDSDEQFKGISSRLLLQKVQQLIAGKGLSVSNVDATIVAQAPKMASHIPNIKQHISEDLAVGIERVNIKATTTEGMGFVGRGEGIAVHAVALLDE